MCDYSIFCIGSVNCLSLIMHFCHLCPFIFFSVGACLLCGAVIVGFSVGACLLCGAVIVGFFRPLIDACSNTKEDERAQVTKVHNQTKTINRANTKYRIIAHISIISVISYAVTPVREIT